LSLSISEVGLIKGLLRSGKVSQQQIIAAFSFPDRTVNHNVVSEISRGIRYGDDVAFPPASEDECDAFLNFLSWYPVWQPDWWLWQYNQISGPFSFSYSYHPVGQGLFCSGFFTRRHRPPFRWVFDCGTERGRSDTVRGDYVRREIAALAEQQSESGNHPHLNLVALSHFDEDHLSGMVDLLRTFSVGTLILPYLPPWDRLVVALDEGASANSDLLSFLLAPTAFLSGIEGSEIDRILLVPPSGEEPALPPALPPDGTDPDETREGVFDEETKKEPPPEEDEDGLGDPGLASENVYILPRGAAITVGRAWEFVPYNDASLAGLATPAFKSDARDLAKQLVEADTDAGRETALTGLINIYDKQFKTPGSPKISAERRNKISLFLYSGPIGNVQLTFVAEEVLRHRLDPARMAMPVELLGQARFGQMFTGDGYLETRQQWSDFHTFYAAHDRLRRGAIFQVMHHGSDNNWHAGVAAKIQPFASLFCSDPAGKHHHPSEEVLEDFAPYNPKQIDAFHGWTLSGTYRFVQ